jgi:hypothetical protein
MARIRLSGLLCSLTIGIILFHPVLNFAQEAAGTMDLQETINAALTANLGLRKMRAQPTFCRP